MLEERDLVSEAQRIIEDVGVHRHVGARVTGAEWSDGLARLHVTLLYYAAHPICCAEPACYVPFLQPSGLEEIALEYQHVRGLLIAPEIEIVVTPAFETGFEYRDDDRLDTTPMSFRARW